MTILQYMNEIGMQFWHSAAVSSLVGVAEWTALLFFVHCYSAEHCLLRRGLCLHGAMLALCLLVQFWHFPVLLHVLLMIVLSTSYICLLTRCSWFNGVLESSVFCLYIELGKSLCRDGLLAYGFSRLFAGIGSLGLNLTMLGLYLAYLGLLCVLFLFRRRRALNLPITTAQTAGLLFPLLVYLAVRVLQYDQVGELDNLGWLRYDLLQYAVAVCALLVIGITRSMLAAQIERNELMHRQLLMEQKLQQYEVQRESIAYINRRYHDLKHYLNGIEAILSQAEHGARADFGQAEAFVQTLKKEIDPYADIQRTGSPVMDVLLAQRIQECHSKQIRLLPYIDASQTGFISTLDLCALFGNAMDNAIEAADVLEEEGLREINVKIGTSDGLLLMRFQNYYQGARNPNGEGFRTTKEDSDAHGYGLSNIAAIAETYGGTISLDCTDKEFTLHILIPLPEERAQ